MKCLLHLIWFEDDFVIYNLISNYLFIFSITLIIKIFKFINKNYIMWLNI